MDAVALLRSVIELEEDRLRVSVPSNRRAAVLAVLNQRDRYVDEVHGADTDVVFGRPIRDAGGNRAIALILDSPATGGSVTQPDDTWAREFLDRCRQMVEAEQIERQIESGFMRSDAMTDVIHVWIASKQIPTNWRERDDFSWWSRHSGSETWQMGYPVDATLDGLRSKQWREVLVTLRRFVDRSEGPCLVARWPDLVESVVTDLVIGRDGADRAVRGFLVDQSNAAFHATVPGVASAPLIDIGNGEVILSRAGLMTQPLLFLTREIRRRSGQDYHNASAYRETLFRQELYDLFADKRFVTSVNRIELRSQQGNLRTDVDAAVFDRKSGSLATFELKSQDPFARSGAEYIRQRNNFLHANRQVSGMLDWLNRNSANELLNRVDSRTAKQFRVQNVYPFVIGRYLAHFTGGSPKDPRAGWCTWPQLLKELERQPIAESGTNPLASLFARIRKGPETMLDLEQLRPRTIDIADIEIEVHPKFAQYRGAGPDA